MASDQELLAWLSKWYRDHCDGRWEHDHGVQLETLDNPGWLLKVDLIGTRFEDRATDQVVRRTGEPPSAANGNLGGPLWLECQIREKRFEGAGDPTKLVEIINCFRDWVEKT